MNKLPKSQQPKAKAALHEIWMAASRKKADTAFSRFLTQGITFKDGIREDQEKVAA